MYCCSHYTHCVSFVDSIPSVTVHPSGAYFTGQSMDNTIVTYECGDKVRWSVGCVGGGSASVMCVCRWDNWKRRLSEDTIMLVMRVKLVTVLTVSFWSLGMGKANCMYGIGSLLRWVSASKLLILNTLSWRLSVLAHYYTFQTCFIATTCNNTYTHVHVQVYCPIKHI